MKAPEMAWPGVVDGDGVLHLDASKGMKAWVAATLRNAEVEVIVRKRRKPASQRQHGWYRAVALPMIADDMGHSKWEYAAVHDALMREIVGLKEGCDPRLQIRASTGEMSTVEFTDHMIEQVQVWAATKLGLVIPDPDPEWKAHRARAKRAA